MSSPCKLCSAICCKDYFITVTSFDVVRVAEKLNKKPEEFAVLEPARIFNQDNETVLECYNYSGGKEDKGGTQTRYDYILTFKSHPCIFLDIKANLCTIFDVAPRGCRSYPLNLEGKMLPHPRCPSIAGFAFRVSGFASRISNPRRPASTNLEYARELAEYKKIVSEWNSRHGTKEECFEFILNQTEKTMI